MVAAFLCLVRTALLSSSNLVENNLAKRQTASVSLKPFKNILLVRI
jgi:hypothetical protein